jgi:hypothetical protein
VYRSFQVRFSASLADANRALDGLEYVCDPLNGRNPGQLLPCGVGEDEVNPSVN